MSDSRPLKPDAGAFTAYIDELKQAPWLDKSREWWPRFIFHFTNLNNALHILESGVMKCRSVLEETGEMATDNASSTVIMRTQDRWKNYVRLYFRPRTPTQHNNEGFRPVGQREMDSHCPFPIYFLFDSKRILVRSDACFSKGSLASGLTRVDSDFRSFKEIPFKIVYHDSSFEPHERDSIIFHRHAEVVVPDQLDLGALKRIICRSEAEYQTLLQLLSPDARKRWESIIGTSNKALFYKKWLFIDKVDLSSESIHLTFNKPNRTIDPFHIRIEVDEISTGVQYVWEDRSYHLKPTHELSLRKLKDTSVYRATVYFDEQIMYSNTFNTEDDQMPY